jgi:hypothetical protein
MRSVPLFAEEYAPQGERTEPLPRRTEPQPRRALRQATLLLLLTTLLAGGSLKLGMTKGAIIFKVANLVGFFQSKTAEASDYFVEQPMSNPPGESLNMSVRMLGLENKGVHVLGHLVKVENPIGRVSVALPPGGCGHREKTTVTAQSHSPKCRLAVNAGYFNVSDAACIGNLVSDGAVIHSVPLEESNVNFGIRDGKIAIGYFTREELKSFQHLVSGVTWLVRDGKSYVKTGWNEANTTVQTSGDKYISNLASRTAAGVDAEGRLIIIQIDGSIAVGSKKRGLNMYEIADLLIDHGAVHAVNLDGGGSSAMARDGVLINYPSDMRPPSCYASGLYQCERPVSTILCVHEDESGSSAGAFAKTFFIFGGGFLLGANCIATIAVVALRQKLLQRYAPSLFGEKKSSKPDDSDTDETENKAA